MKILIIKTSALGDIVQSLSVLDYLRSKWPEAQIDWVVEKTLASLVSAHPFVSETIPIDLKGFKKRTSSLKELLESIRNLRKTEYDVAFDLQGNCKSGVLTFLVRAKEKVGFGLKSVREWPNLLATRKRFNVPKETNIRLQYVELIQQYLADSGPIATGAVQFQITPSEQKKVELILSSEKLLHRMKIMVCPGSKWSNKQLPLETFARFLEKIEKKLNASFLLMWGAESEKAFCEELSSRLEKMSVVVEKLPIPTWQNLMHEMDLVIAVDSSALHLCGTTQAPSFSLFGPTSPAIFKPVGMRHFALQGSCPYGQTFPKACPKLRSCPTGACLRNLSDETIFEAFSAWWNRYRGEGRQSLPEYSRVAPL